MADLAQGLLRLCVLRAFFALCGHEAREFSLQMFENGASVSNSDVLAPASPRVFVLFAGDRRPRQPVVLPWTFAFLLPHWSKARRAAKCSLSLSLSLFLSL